MKKFRRLAFIALFVLITAAMLAGCGSQEDSVETEDASLKIVATIFPAYDWVMNVLGDNPAGAEVTLLLDDGVDLHSFQPTAQDIQKISDCDLFIYAGGESDNWVEDALQEAINPEMISINLLESVGDNAKEEEEVEGMEAEAGDEEEPEYDEHVWLSLRNAEKLVDEISGTLCRIDADNAQGYKDNAAAYMAELKAVDEEYEKTVAGAKYGTLLFGDRFPFRYMTDDYGIQYYAAFAGCSAETEASFETITFLANKLEELQLPAVLTTETSDGRIAETIIMAAESPDTDLLSMNSMQAVTSDDVAAGASYTGMMKDNLEALKKALN
ncbi:MAG: zinc ABC transporter substrate-binding protein [Firmicutes bacterium]|nr:zinc ABC transporter substrate-binding protein [Bacillota bacterium]